MENENQYLSAERSLEIISATMEANRKATLDHIARPLVIWGLFVIITSLVSWYLYDQLSNRYIIVSWFLVVVIGFVVEFFLESRKGNRFGNTFGHTIGAIWGAFSMFALFLGVLNLLLYVVEPNPLAVIILAGTIPVIVIVLMSMAGVITGLVLKNCPIVFTGALGGVLSFLGYYFELDNSAMLMFAFTALVELVVPGIILLVRSKKK